MKRKITIPILILILCVSVGSEAEDEPQRHTNGAQNGEMVRVPAGEFTMGSNSGQGDEKPVHRVYLDEFYIDKYEVTNEQYQQCVNGGPCSLAHYDDGSCWVYNGKKWGKGVLPQSFRGSSQPVVCIDWNQADTYCKWAGKRLPTEAEWEKAARGTDGRTYPWGEEIDCSRANYSKCGHKKTMPVGSYPSGASPYGALDMAGNTWEWVADWYDENYYRNSPGRNPTGPSSGKYRVLRGGSWSYFPHYLRTSRRFRSGPGAWYKLNYGGFRCASAP